MGQGGGQFQWRAAQVELDGPVGDSLGDAVEGEAGGATEGLGVEQQQEAGDAVDGVQRGVVEESACQGPSVVGVDEVGTQVLLRARWDGDGDGVAAADGPEDEVACLVAVSAACCQPVVDIALVAVGQAAAVGPELADQVAGDRDLAFDRQGLVEGDLAGGRALAASAKAAQAVPGEEPVDSSTFGEVADLRFEERGEPALQRGELFVALGQSTVGDQRRPQSGDGLRWATTVEQGVESGAELRPMAMSMRRGVGLRSQSRMLSGLLVISASSTAWPAGCRTRSVSPSKSCSWRSAAQRMQRPWW